MASYQEFIALALEQALAGNDPNASPLLDLDMVAESLVPTVFQQVALRYYADEDTRSLLLRTHTISMTNGVGTIPDPALTQCWKGAYVSDPADVTVVQLQAYTPNWNDFVQPRSGLMAQIPLWTIKGDDDLHYLEAGEDYDPAAGFTGDLDLTIASVPEIPATFSDPLVVPDEVLSDLITALAAAIRNQPARAA